MMNIGKRRAARARDRIDVRIIPICDTRSVFYSCLTNDGAGWGRALRLHRHARL